MFIEFSCLPLLAQLLKSKDVNLQYWAANCLFSILRENDDGAFQLVKSGTFGGIVAVMQEIDLSSRVQLSLLKLMKAVCQCYQPAARFLLSKGNALLEKVCKLLGRSAAGVVVDEGEEKTGEMKLKATVELLLVLCCHQESRQALKESRVNELMYRVLITARSSTVKELTTMGLSLLCAGSWPSYICLVRRRDILDLLSRLFFDMFLLHKDDSERRCWCVNAMVEATRTRWNRDRIRGTGVLDYVERLILVR